VAIQRMGSRQVAFHRGPDNPATVVSPMPHTGVLFVGNGPGRTMCVVSPRTRDDRNTAGCVRQHARAAAGKTFTGYDGRAAH